MKPRCGLGVAAELAPAAPASAEFAVPSALASGGASSEPRMPQPASARPTRETIAIALRLDRTTLITKAFFALDVLQPGKAHATGPAVERDLMPGF